MLEGCPLFKINTMKLLVITCVQESKKDVIHLLHQSGIFIFSMTDITGFKEDPPEDLRDHWFSAGHERFDSLLFFSFCNEEKTNKALQNIRQYNESGDRSFPLRGFKIAVEDATFINDQL